MYYELKRASRSVSIWINFHTIIHKYIIINYIDMYEN